MDLGHRNVVLKGCSCTLAVDFGIVIICYHIILFLVFCLVLCFVCTLTCFLVFFVFLNLIKCVCGLILMCCGGGHVACYVPYANMVKK